MSIEYVVESACAGMLFTEHAVLGGPLAFDVERLMGRRLDRTFAATTAHGRALRVTAPVAAELDIDAQTAIAEKLQATMIYDGTRHLLTAVYQATATTLRRYGIQLVLKLS